jgi:hypothetical protein
MRLNIVVVKIRAATYKKAMRFFAIIFGCLFLLFSFLFMIREWGYRQTNTEFKHPFLEQITPWKIIQIDNQEDARAALKLDPQVIFMLPLRVTEQGQFFLQFNDQFEDLLHRKLWPQELYRGPKPYFYSLEQLQVVFPDLVKVEDFLTEFPDSRIIFNIIDSAQNVHENFIRLIQARPTKNIFLVQSDTDVILKSIKEREPMWVYGTSYPEINRFLSFESIGVASATQLRSDVYISPLRISNRPVFTAALNSELRRRKKKIILGPVSGPAEHLQAQQFDVDGIIFRSLEDLK